MSVLKPKPPSLKAAGLEPPYIKEPDSVQFSCSVVSDSAIPWIAACQASLSIINSKSLLKLMSIELVMPSNHPTLCCPLLLLPPILPSISLFQWVNSSHEVAQVLEFQLQHQSFQWTPKTEKNQIALLQFLLASSNSSSPFPKEGPLPNSPILFLYRASSMEQAALSEQFFYETGPALWQSSPRTMRLQPAHLVGS